MDTTKIKFVERPGPGLVGRSIKVRTNYFEITDLPFPKIYHYNVAIIPEVPPSLNRKIFQVTENSFFGVKIVSDGRRNVYTVRPFPFDVRHTLNVTLPEEVVGRRPSRTFKILIEKVSVINMEEINKYLNGRGFITLKILNNMLKG
jgi:hypothetical protein